MPPPGSPLSPKMQSLGIPSSSRRVRPVPHGRQPSSGTAAALRLPSLPRFHPANFASSQNSSAAATPATGPNSPQPPLSPRTYHRQYYEAQHQMYLYSPGQPTRAPTTRPTSPRLMPLNGSPGPVTPLELEGTDGYLTAGISTSDAASHVDTLIKEEALRRGDASPGRSTTAGGR
ncbi:uncharacterized protein EI97DRAFT_371843 [Westerdykella ornata]|uniref:Uncharacterized protein n=1 Tax=Westerdykella ornata TaxID=318751 RepID=A0A6A6JQA7_WESOR|nr:uncharacterized protein EI97DRAFT_371843 [Westerdykella ornata]KAF2278811.1 hypothetical protein EI97DRAFT_371843 [Westerdykella ornata]